MPQMTTEALWENIPEMGAQLLLCVLDKSLVSWWLQWKLFSQVIIEPFRL